MQITLGHLTSQLTTILKNNAPVRTKPLGAIKYSPYPGNMRNNAIVEQISGDTSTVAVGGAAAPYAIYTEKTSHRPGWMQKSQNDLLAMCRMFGGKIK